MNFGSSTSKIHNNSDNHQCSFVLEIIDIYRDDRIMRTLKLRTYKNMFF